MSLEENFQKHFVNHCLRDSDFLMNVYQDVHEDMFSDDTLKKVIRLVLTFAEENKAAPGTLIFSQLDDWRAKGLINETLHKTVTTYIDGLFALQLQNRTYLLNKFNSFARQQLAKTKIIPFTEAIKRDDFEYAEQIMKDIFTFRPARAVELGGFLDPDPIDRLSRRLASDHERFWTLIPDIDRRIDGLMAGELGVLQSQRTSIGKSAALQFFAKSFAFQGKTVLIYSLEMSKDAYEDRLDQCIAGITRKDLFHHDTITHSHEKIQDALRRMTKLGGRIFIKKFPMYLTKVSDLRNHYSMMQNVLGVVPDVMILDYADLLAPETTSLRGDLHAVGAEVYGHLVGWLDELQIPCWTAAQSGRGAMEETRADVHHIGGSIAKTQIAHVILTLNRSPQEELENLITLFVAKNREGPARYSFTIHTDLAKMAFWSRHSDDFN